MKAFTLYQRWICRGGVLILLLTDGKTYKTALADRREGVSILKAWQTRDEAMDYIRPFAFPGSAAQPQQ